MKWAILVLSLLLVGADAELCAQEQVMVIDASKYQPTRLGGADVDALADLIVRQTNEFRKAEKLEKLKVDEILEKSAKQFASYMAEHDRYGHTADGNTPSQRAKQHGYKLCLIAENIAYRYKTEDFRTEQLARILFNGWKKSKPHRKNMLDVDMTRTAVAVAQSQESGHYYAVQLFGRPQSEMIRFKIKNRSDEVITYEFGGKEIELKPRIEWSHHSCRPMTLTLTADPDFEQEITPKKSVRYVIRVGEDGELLVEEEALESPRPVEKGE